MSFHSYFLQSKKLLGEIILTRCILVLFLISYQIFSCEPALSDFNRDCTISTEYKTLKVNFKEKFDIDIEMITFYRALRFISEYSWDNYSDEHQFLPWKVYNPVPITWLMWERGDDYMKNSLPAPADITLDDIQSLHDASIIHQIMSNKARKSKDAYPGRLRGIISRYGGGNDGYRRLNSCSDELSPPRKKFHKAPAWNFKCFHEVKHTQISLLKDYDLKTECGTPLVRIVKGPKACGDGNYSGKINYLPSHIVYNELQRAISYMREGYQALLRGELNSSPIELAADVQRWIVSIHPFGDGNGRLSRFVADKILRSFGLPYMPSGYLTNDVINNQNKYREMTYAQIERLIGELKNCYSQYENGEPDVKCRPITYSERYTDKDHKTSKERLDYSKVFYDFISISNKDLPSYIESSAYIGEIKKKRESPR